MISEIRDYIKTQIKGISTQYFEIDNPFSKDEDAVGTKVDYSYAVDMGTSAQEINENREVVDNITVTLRTYRQGTKDKLADFDDGYCQALLINALLLDKTNFINAKYILSVTSGGVTPSEVLDSQDVYAYTNNLVFKLSYGLGD